MSREFYKELSPGTQNCQRTKNNLKLSKAGRPRNTLGRKARITGREINSGATRLNNIIFNNREILGNHFIRYDIKSLLLQVIIKEKITHRKEAK